METVRLYRLPARHHCVVIGRRRNDPNARRNTCQRRSTVAWVRRAPLGRSAYINSALPQ